MPKPAADAWCRALGNYAAPRGLSSAARAPAASMRDPTMTLLKPITPSRTRLPNPNVALLQRRQARALDFGNAVSQPGAPGDGLESERLPGANRDPASSS